MYEVFSFIYRVMKKYDSCNCLILGVCKVYEEKGKYCVVVLYPENVKDVFNVEYEGSVSDLCGELCRLLDFDFRELHDDEHRGFSELELEILLRR